MPGRDRRCVFVAGSLGEADVVAQWLVGKGFDAKVMDALSFASLDGTFSSLGVGAAGIEIWVRDASQAQAAREHLAARSESMTTESGKRRQ
jgi:hypothetical protein